MAARRKKSKCKYGKVRSGRRKGQCLKHRRPRGTLHAGPLRPGERRKRSYTKTCKNGPVIQKGPRRGMCPKRRRSAKKVPFGWAVT